MEIHEIAEQIGPVSKDHKVRCPLHQDRRPSLHLYPDHFHCYSCGAHGDAYDLLGLVRFGADYDPKRHFGLLRREMGEGIPTRSRRPRPGPPPLSLELVERYHRQRTEAVVAYLASRGLPETLIEPFRLGQRGSYLTISTIADGQVHGIKLRNMEGGEPRYLSQKGSSHYLFNADLLNRESEVFLVEGELDTLSLLTLWYPVVGLSGGAASFRPEWAERLQGKSVHLLFDSDPAGRLGALRTLSLLPHADVWAYPEGIKDGNDWLVAGGRGELRRLDSDALAAQVAEENAEQHDGIVPAYVTKILTPEGVA